MTKKAFNTEEAIRTWLQLLRKNPAFEEGDILELEVHVRDEMDRLVEGGAPEKRAFESAIEGVGDPMELGMELHKSRAHKPGKPPSWSTTNVLALIPNFWKIGIRNFSKNRVYGTINLFGLAIGISSCLLIGLYTHYHLSFDRHHKESEALYRITTDVRSENGERTRNLAYTPGLWGPGLVDEFPQFTSFTRFFQYRDDIIVHNELEDVEFFERNFFWTDASVFDVFGFELLQGEATSALARPNTIVISASMAKKYFGFEDPLGKVLDYINGDSVYPLEVTGVFQDVPPNTHFHPEFMASLLTIADLWWIQDYDRMDSWSTPFWITYLKSTNVELPVSTSAINQFLDHKIGADSARFDASLQPVAEIHLHSHLSGEFEDNGNVDFLYGLGTIAVFILLIACINFMNLATAKATKRMKEVGIRKVMGSNRKELIGQFFGESVLMCIVAFLIGVFFTEVLRPRLNAFTGDDIPSTYLFSTWFWSYGVTLVLVVGVLAGSYPALYLSGFKPAAILRNKFMDHSKGETFRKVLVVGQFSLSVFLLICTLVIFRQLSYLSSKTLGFDNELQITLPLRGPGLQSNPDILRDRLKSNPKVLEVAFSSNVLMKGWHNGALEFPDRKSDKTVIWDFLHVDHDFAKSLGIELVAGRYPSRSLAMDSSASIVNESAVKAMGLSNEEMLGMRIQNNWGVDGRVVGVARDFHYARLHEPIRPFAMLVNYDFGIRFINIKVRGNDLASTIGHIEEQWKALSPETPFFFHFLDDRIEQLYETEQKQGKLMANFTTVAIIISCLGLFGLVSHMTERRRKEIGIRKVLGASVVTIVNILSMEFLMQVGIGFLIGAPLAWIAMMNWLDAFAYRIQPGVDLLLIAGGMTLIVAMLTVSWQSIRSALSNPVNSLKDE